MLESQILLAYPGRDYCEILDHVRTIDAVFFDGQKLNRPASFAEGFFFASQSGVDQTKHAIVRAILGLILHPFFLGNACSAKCSFGLCRALRHPSDHAFAEMAIEQNGIGPESVFSQFCQSAFCHTRVTLRQSTDEVSV